MTSLSRRGLFGLAAGGVAAAALPAPAPVVIMKPASCGMTEISAVGLLMVLGGLHQIYNPRKAD